jgi:hypothetical protein
MNKKKLDAQSAQAVIERNAGSALTKTWIESSRSLTITLPIWKLKSRYFKLSPIALRSCAKSYAEKNLTAVQEVGQRDREHKSQDMHNETACTLDHRLVE